MIDNTRFPLLARAQSPAELRALELSELDTVCQELRAYLIESVAKTGGHLGASLGTIELTVALHYVFETPEDRLVWDVGHQAYGHKILTERANRMDTMRKKDGLAAFPCRQESHYDTFGVGHSSTSISAGLGMSIGNRIQQGDRKVVSVIGDGAITAGMAFEAMNNAGDWKADMLVVLNDNDMSISPNVGALNKYLTRIWSGPTYNTAREGGKKVLKHMPPMMELARRAEEHAKGMVAPGTLFEEFGFNYYGPVDGHDVQGLVKVLNNLHKLPGPLFLHVVTQKGKGYRFAEQDALALHAVTPFDPSVGIVKNPNSKKAVTYTDVFSDWLCDQAEQDERLVGITPAMREGSGLVKFEQCFPERYFDVAIAEQHAVTFAAGLACEGLKPVVAIYSTFLQRGYDQFIHDVALQNLPVLFAIDRAGLVGPDGATHAGSFDLSFLRCVPNLVVMAPADENECRQMLHTGFLHDGPAAVRYPRGSGNGTVVDTSLTPLPIGKAQLRRRGDEHGVVLLAFGTLVDIAEAIAPELNATVLNMRFIKPIDLEAVKAVIGKARLVVTLEENTVQGGAGSAVVEALIQDGQPLPPLLQIGLPDRFLPHGSREELLTEAGLDLDGVRQQIEYRLSQLGLQQLLVTATPEATQPKEHTEPEPVGASPRNT